MEQKKSECVVLFAYALAGFGHLRVTDALLHGLDRNIPRYLFDSKEWSLIATHRIMSIHPIARRVMEWVQMSKTAEHYFTKFYRKTLTSYPEKVYDDISKYLKRHHVETKHIVVIATHFGLAHQMSVAKGIFRQHGIHLTIIVQVTDDSPQSIWYVPGADYTFVPSIETKQVLDAYGKKNKLARTKIIVSPYPISPILSQIISKKEQKEREKQYDFEEKDVIRIAVPISGAAVALEYYESLIPKLHQLSDRFFFHIISKDTIYTHPFLKKMKKYSYVEIHSETSDHGIVKLYEKVYTRNNISFEITKPSEQAFKALLSSHCVGGSVLLFSRAVGRQERDNIKFLQKHHLTPSIEEQHHMWKKAEKLTEDCCALAKSWRGVVLPEGSTASARLIFNLLERGVFKTMVSKKHEEQNEDEVSEHGVKLFWDRVWQLLKKEEA